MKSLIQRVCRQRQHPAHVLRSMQLLSMIFLVAGGCATSPPPGLSRIPEGLYRFDAPIFYENGMARITHTPRGARVQLLETFQGSFTLVPDAQGGVRIEAAEIDYPGLRRSLKGDGRLTGPGQAGGHAVMWLKAMGPVSRNHREGPWSLRPATAEEIRNFQAKEKMRQQRMDRAREAGLEI